MISLALYCLAFVLFGAWRYERKRAEHERSRVEHWRDQAEFYKNRCLDYQKMIDDYIRNNEAGG